MPKLSIIVPVYKVEQYLHKCIDSILSQPFTDFELILIDDGSPDCCGKICDEYAAKDDRIIVIHQKNRGVSAARNAGLDIARGEYIGFVDSDDWIEPKMYEIMLIVAKKMQVDVVMCGHNYIAEQGNILRTEACEEVYFHDSEDLIKELFRIPIRIGGGCCNKIFRRSVISDNRFLENIKMKEDGIFLFDCFSKSSNGYAIYQSLYNYYQGKSSSTRADLVSALYNTIPSEKLLYQRAKQHSIKIEGLALDKIIDDLIRYAGQIKRSKASVFTRRYLYLKAYTIKLIWVAWTKRLIHKKSIHGHLFNLLCFKME